MSATLHSIIPKTAKRSYKKHPITVTFLPQSKEWKWEVVYVRTTRYGDVAKNMNAAFKAAEKHIDLTLKARGG